MRDPKYDVLSEPVPIGPLVAKNRMFRRGDPADRPAASAQRGDGCVVVGLGGDLGHQLGMQHGAV